VQESTNGHGNGVTVAIEEKELEQTNVMDEWGDSEPIKEDAEPIPAKVDADVETVDSQVDSASPTPIPVTESIYIANLVRPFTVGQLKEALERFGTVVFFWIDPIKSHAYVTVSCQGLYAHVTDTHSQFHLVRLGNIISWRLERAFRSSLARCHRKASRYDPRPYQFSEALC
jgi:hypothetical protein